MTYKVKNIEIISDYEINTNFFMIYSVYRVLKNNILSYFDIVFMSLFNLYM